MLKRLSKEERKENEKKNEKDKGAEELVSVWGVRRCDNNKCSRTFWNRDTNAARNILKVFLSSVQGVPLPAPFLRSHDKFGKTRKEAEDAVATVVTERRKASRALSDETPPTSKRTNTTEV